MGRLSRHREEIQRPGITFRNSRWDAVYPVMQEVLLSEPLTRTIAYLAAVLEDRGVDSDFGPLAASSLAAHVEARNRCLHLIVFGPGLPVESAVRLNRIRRKLELFTDQLLAALPFNSRCDLFSFDADAVQRSQSELQQGGLTNEKLRVHTAGLIESLWNSLDVDLDPRRSSGRLNQKLSEVVLSMYAPEMFDSFGVPKSLELLRLEANSLESDGRSDDWLEPLSEPLKSLQAPIPNRRINSTAPRRWS